MSNSAPTFTNAMGMAGRSGYAAAKGHAGGMSATMVLGILVVFLTLFIAQASLTIHMSKICTAYKTGSDKWKNRAFRYSVGMLILALISLLLSFAAIRAEM